MVLSLRTLITRAQERAGDLKPIPTRLILTKDGEARKTIFVASEGNQ